jgi:hypothetical protein
MSIEIAEVSDKNFTYEEAIMYCFFLEIDGKKGWRLPTEQEYNSYNNVWGWYQDDQRYKPGDLQHFRITPVRDIDD